MRGRLGRVLHDQLDRAVHQSEVSAGLWTNHSSPGVQAVVEEAEVGAAVLHRHGAELQPVPPLVQRAPVRGVPLSRNTSIGNKYFFTAKYFCLATDLSDLVVVSEEAEAGVGVGGALGAGAAAADPLHQVDVGGGGHAPARHTNVAPRPGHHPRRPRHGRAWVAEMAVIIADKQV